MPLSLCLWNEWQSHWPAGLDAERSGCRRDEFVEYYSKLASHASCLRTVPSRSLSHDIELNPSRRTVVDVMIYSLIHSWQPISPSYLLPKLLEIDTLLFKHLLRLLHGDLLPLKIKST